MTMMIKLPRLRRTNKSSKCRYKLKKTRKQRRTAIDCGIGFEKRKTGKTLRQAAISKKARFNVLRIYRRYKRKNECKKITRDMRYIDKRYKLKLTRDICDHPR